MENFGPNAPEIPWPDVALELGALDSDDSVPAVGDVVVFRVSAVVAAIRTARRVLCGVVLVSLLLQLRSKNIVVDGHRREGPWYVLRRMSVCAAHHQNGRATHK